MTSGTQPGLLKSEKLKGPIGTRLDRTTGWAIEIFRFLEKIARRKLLTCALLAALPIVLRLATLPLIPIPQPQVHDEFSYLLAGETFASGRLTSPTPAMWAHFETFHELFQPTYMSKYPPGQGLFLALGWRLFGNPWYGVLISFSFFYGCLCWMLQGWMPPAFALLGCLLELCQVTPFGYWMNSYWGGAVAAAAGCLVAGAVPRLARAPRPMHAVIAAFGLVLLSISRPYEGLVFSIATTTGLLWWRQRRGRPFREFLSPRLVTVFVVICLAGVIFNGYYNYRITGNPVRVPYQAYFEKYSIAPNFFILPARTPPVYRSALMERHFEAEVVLYKKRRMKPLGSIMHVVFWISPFFWSAPIFIAVVSGAFFSRSVKFWLPMTLGVSLCFAALIETITFAHYFAPGAGLVALLAGQGMRVIRLRARNFGLLLLLLILTAASGNILSEAKVALTDSYAVLPRVIASRIALQHGGKHLILVRYSPEHSYDRSDVYNSANIDASSIVWAHDMGSDLNREIIGYYPDRRVWLWQPDKALNTLTPYPGG